MSPEPTAMAEAERAAYDLVYAGAHNVDHSMIGLKPGATCPRCESTARAVVAVLRPLLLEEAADLIENSDSLRSFTDNHMRDIEMAAEELRRAAAALRTTTPEKEN
jgi:predicted transcriptional regulator